MSLPRITKRKYTIEQIIAFSVGVIFIFISLYIFISIHEAMVENANIEQAHIFHLPFNYSFHNDSITDIEMDLTISYPSGILTEGDPVSISGIAVTDTQIAQSVVDVAVNFQNAQAYPVTQNKKGITEGISLNMLRSPDNNKLVGNTTVVWNIVGTYYPRLYITQIQDGHPMYNYSETEDVAITVYPKSEIAQIVTNKATLLLAFAAYLIALVGVFNIIYNLWTKNSTSQVIYKKNETDTEKK